MDASSEQQHDSGSRDTLDTGLPRYLEGYRPGDGSHRVKRTGGHDHFFDFSVSPAHGHGRVSNTSSDMGQERPTPSRIGRGDCDRCKARGLRCRTGPLNPASCSNCSKLKVPCINAESALDESQHHEAARCIQEIENLKQRVERIEQQQEAFIGLSARRGYEPSRNLQPNTGMLHWDHQGQFPWRATSAATMPEMPLAPVPHAPGGYVNAQFVPAFLENAQDSVMHSVQANSSFTVPAARGITFNPDSLA
ncbi:hypothetical protein AJ79_09286 [Helicocarpus griseus UAMH5409]|uniref:Zn(2)-C6 fungal-type domain-containing protein n=1 Tax=Helicocarpus griseus UAMH5409 TaxID=1447875 RepID=A0A2B7WL37_9EURO|nr:hypothetical protein AJ79_09286 [Helicocarpus griseus UAMH5409]